MIIVAALVAALGSIVGFCVILLAWRD